MFVLEVAGIADLDTTGSNMSACMFLCMFALVALEVAGIEDLGATGRGSEMSVCMSV